MKSPYFICLILLSLSACSPSSNSQQDKDLIESVIESYDNGKAKSVHFLNASNEIVKQKLYYESGTMQAEGSFLDGKRHGSWTAYYENGFKWSLNNYSKGVLDGEYNTWYETGTPRIEGHYTSGKTTGIWKYYNDAGLLVREDDRDNSPS